MERIKINEIKGLNLEVTKNNNKHKATKKGDITIKVKMKYH